MAATEKITYVVRKCNLVDQENKEGYFALVLHGRNVIDHDGIVREMSEKNTTVSRQDIISVLDLYRETIIRRLQQGFKVYSSLFSAHVSIRGTFASDKESFDPARHELHVKVSPDQALLKRVVKGAELRKLDTDPEVPVLKTYFDINTETTNSIATAGFAAEIRGKRMEMDTSREDHGIWFVNPASKEEVKVERIIRHSGTNIMFIVPQLSAGNWQIKFAGGRCAEPKIVILAPTLSVAESMAA